MPRVNRVSPSLEQLLCIESSSARMQHRRMTCDRGQCNNDNYSWPQEGGRLLFARHEWPFLLIHYNQSHSTSAGRIFCS